MFRQSIIAFMALVVAMLAVVTPVLAGGWAVVTLDTLPREVRAQQNYQLGFVVRQHGKTPTNRDLNGKPLKPVLTARKQATPTSRLDSQTLVLIAAPASVQAKGEDTIRVEARQEGAVGHYVADVTFPSDGVWEWQIEVPTYYVQNGANSQGGNAAIFTPLTVLPALGIASEASAPAPQLAAATSAPAESVFLGLSSSVLRWSGVILLLIALSVLLYTRWGWIGRRRVARSS